MKLMGFKGLACAIHSEFFFFFFTSFILHLVSFINSIRES
jgi:hypothetical protein